MRRVPWLLLAVVLGALGFAAGAAYFYVGTLRRLLTGEEDLREESLLDDAAAAVGDAVRAAGDAVSASPYPARWGGGIRRLRPAARPFFAALFRALEARGYSPRSNAPHRDLEGQGDQALDIVDNAWPRNAWQEPVEPYLTFYRTLGAIAESLGLVWGGRWVKYHGSDLPWAKRWREVADLGDMLHVEWRSSTGIAVPELPEEGTT